MKRRNGPDCCEVQERRLDRDVRYSLFSHQTISLVPNAMPLSCPNRATFAKPQIL
jgi:hypothetical protein